jgi:hypothetical protein
MNQLHVGVDHQASDRDRFSIEVRGHEVMVDQPLAAAGTDLGSTPTELFAASLAACVPSPPNGSSGVTGCRPTACGWRPTPPQRPTHRPGWRRRGGAGGGGGGGRPPPPPPPPPPGAGGGRPCTVHNSITQPQVRVELTTGPMAACGQTTGSMR